MVRKGTLLGKDLLGGSSCLLYALCLSFPI